VFVPDCSVIVSAGVASALAAMHDPGSIIVTTTTSASVRTEFHARTDIQLSPHSWLNTKERSCTIVP
jgi:hypothetical protein